MRKGFTLLELLIVVVIIGILALIAAPTLLNAADQARNGTVLANVSAAASSVTSQFALNSGQAATTVATTVATALNTNNQNPIDSTTTPFVAAASGTKGQVSLDADDTNNQVTIKGYDKGGAALITKVVAAPQ